MKPFEWDEAKAQANLRKHKVDFEEATSVFTDSLSADVHDPDHSGAEERFIVIGYSNKHRWLMIAYTQRSNHIRIISARKLTRAERRDYEEVSRNG